MKLKSIVSLLGLTASLGAFAVPLAPNSPAPSVINPPPGSEGSLQSIADILFGAGHINVNTGQSSAGQFSSSSPSSRRSDSDAGGRVHRQCRRRRASASGSAPTPRNIVSFNILLGGAVAH